MADDEQFSLCWNNFNSNLSAGFHESLCRGDLVDVTLAAEGQFVKAHRLVLSVCSPYFRKMFTQMPANQHAFVFLKDVSHSALKDLIQFMYCGEVNVKQEALPAFISTAEALQIKGLTDSDPAPSQSPAKPSTPAPQPAPPAQALTSPRVRQRSSTSRSYRIETDDSDDKTTQIVLQATTAVPVQTQPSIVQQQQSSTTTTVVSQKRSAARSISTPHTKRVKNSADPLEASEPTQIAVQTVAESKSTSEPEFIDLPIEIPTKSEPDYSEEAGEVETAEQEATYVEDDSYGDMKYDESYFTENDEAGAATGGTGGATTSTAVVKQSFVDNSYVEQADQSASEAQDTIDANDFVAAKYDDVLETPQLRDMDSKVTIPLLVKYMRLLRKEVQRNKCQCQADMCDPLQVRVTLNLPARSVEEFQELEQKVKVDTSVEQMLVQHFRTVSDRTYKKYIRGCLKEVVTDEVAVRFSFCGKNNNLRVGQYTILHIIKEEAMKKFNTASANNVEMVLKKWFQYAKERVKKPPKN